MRETEGSRAQLKDLTPWDRQRLFCAAVPRFSGTLRRLPSGDWLISCTNVNEQAAVFRITKLQGGILVSTRRPEPVVVGVLRGIPQKQGIEAEIHADLTRIGLKVDSHTPRDGRWGSLFGRESLAF